MRIAIPGRLLEVIFLSQRVLSGMKYSQILAIAIARILSSSQLCSQQVTGVSTREGGLDVLYELGDRCKS
jgi:hypothetical protein